MRYFPIGNISLFNTSYSIDILPGPASNRIIHTAINNSSNSYPLTKPFDNLTIASSRAISLAPGIGLVQERAQTCQLHAARSGVKIIMLIGTVT
jgi:hypothetical protein